MNTGTHTAADRAALCRTLNANTARTALATQIGQASARANRAAAAGHHALATQARDQVARLQAQMRRMPTTR